MTPQAALKYIRPLLAFLVAIGIVAGFAVRLAGLTAWSGTIWAAVTMPVLLALLAEIVLSLRRGDVGLDIVAALSMTAALAVGEELAAAIVALMYAGGQYLEAFAERQARHEMTALLSRVPRTAMRHRDSQLEEVALDLILPGDRLLIRRGDVVPVDGTVVEGVAVLDQSALTGEALPVQLTAGQVTLSGSTNAGDAFDLMATRRAAESTYAGVIRLVEAAQRSRAPMSRLADRYAILFLGVTVLLAGAAGWLTGDSVRAVAVLVVATPCPLILAVPVAIVAGLSRAAKLGILIKGGKAIETLARVRALVIDKTGTLTIGQAKLVDIKPAADMTADKLLRIAASLDQASKHVIAQTIVAEARAKGLTLAVPTEVVETPGEGIDGLAPIVNGGIELLVRQDSSVICFGRESRRSADAFDLPARLHTPRFARGSPDDKELQARRARIQDECVIIHVWRSSMTPGSRGPRAPRPRSSRHATSRYPHGWSESPARVRQARDLRRPR